MKPLQSVCKENLYVIVVVANDTETYELHHRSTLTLDEYRQELNNQIYQKERKYIFFNGVPCLYQETAHELSTEILRSAKHVRVEYSSIDMHKDNIDWARDQSVISQYDNVYFIKHSEGHLNEYIVATQLTEDEDDDEDDKKSLIECREEYFNNINKNKPPRDDNWYNKYNT